MKYQGEEKQMDDHKKWSEWTMKPQKQPRKLTHYVSGFVIAFSIILVIGAPDFLVF